MIIAVGNRNDYNEGRLTEEMVKSILREFVDGWQKRNPNLILIGAYYHADEQGALHAHLESLYLKRKIEAIEKAKNNNQPQPPIKRTRR